MQNAIRITNASIITQQGHMGHFNVNNFYKQFMVYIDDEFMFCVDKKADVPGKNQNRRLTAGKDVMDKV